MILVDANVLIEAWVRGPRHPAAHRWLEAQLWGKTKVGLPWPSLLAFLRIVTNARIYQRPQPMAAAWEQVEEWLSCESVWIPEPTEQHASILGGLCQAPSATGNLVPDAHLAALAIEHGLTLYTLDGDFARFPALRVRNPLVG